MKKQYLFVLFATLFSVAAFSQKPLQIKRNTPIDLKKITPPTTDLQFSTEKLQVSDNLEQISPIIFVPNLPAGLKIETQRNGAPTMISGSLRLSSATATTLEVRNSTYLDALKTVMHIRSPSDEFVVKKSETDNLGITHTRLQQQFQNIPVWNCEVILHEQNQKIQLMNGAYFPTPILKSTEPTIDAATAAQNVRSHLSNNGGFLTLTDKAIQQVGGQQIKSELVIYHIKNNPAAEHLAWHVTAYSNVLHRYEYFVDAQNGAILNSYESSCTFSGHIHDYKASSTKSDATTLLKEQESVVGVALNELSTINRQLSTINLPPLDGPATATAKDLLGVTRTINTYSTSGTYVLIDASRPMFKASQSSFPNSPVCVLQTFDNQNNDGGGSFNFTQSASNNWNSNPTGVSAQYNCATAYLYYLNTHGRNSINGKGGNVDSYINVSDQGHSMDNAYWNGEAMYYGNGDQYFYSLAQGLDVAGHEISHGVIQNTANLTYQDESGALNESMADVFGSFIDRANWTIGENVIKNKNAFPSGSLRDLSNPHNGGQQGDPAWQPAVYSEIYTGSQDNGGVHINSGIPNYAYYLFASNASVGKDKAEKVYYYALVNLLVASSNFLDCRAAIEQASKTLYPNDQSIVAAASNAFATVGIGTGGSANGSSHQTDLPVNTGNDYVLFVGANDTGIYVQTPGGTPQAITNNTIKSKPSISDNGTAVVYVGKDTKLYYISLNWTTGAVKEQEIGGGQTGWNNSAISKDGNKIAANAGDTLIYVINLKTNSSQQFAIYNPTTATGGIRTSDVQYSDALEWDLFGEKVIYDAYNASTGTSTSADYWDIGIITVWSNKVNNFGSGKVQKVFTQLPENTSVGNPTFAKNSPYIIAFDYLETPNANTTNYYLVSANIQTGDVTQNTTGLFKNNTLGYPNFSIKDDKVLYTTVSGNSYALQAIGVTSTKLEPTGGPVSVQTSGQKGAFFTNTSRIISATTDLDKSAVRISPNPFSDQLQIELTATEATEGELNVYDLLGRNIMTQKFRTQIGTNTVNLNTQNLTTGMYLLKARIGNGILTVSVVKE